MKYEAPEEKSKRVSGMMQKLQTDSPKGKLNSIHIEPADNGFSVRVHRDLPPPPAPQQGEGDGSDQVGGSASGSHDSGTSHAVFQKKKHVIAHIQKHLGSDGDGDE